MARGAQTAPAPHTSHHLQTKLGLYLHFACLCVCVLCVGRWQCVLSTALDPLRLTLCVPSPHSTTHRHTTPQADGWFIKSTRGLRCVSAHAVFDFKSSEGASCEPCPWDELEGRERVTGCHSQPNCLLCVGLRGLKLLLMEKRGQVYAYVR